MKRILVLTALLAAGCVDTPDSDHLLLERSQAALEAQGSASWDIVIEADGEQVGTANGEIDFEAEAARTVLHGDVTAELRIIEGTIYQQAPPLARLPEGVRWIRAGPEAIATVMQVEPEVAADLTPDGNVDPADLVGNLSVERVGDDHVDGVDTIHLRVVLAGDALEQRFDQLAAASVALPESALGDIEEVRIDVWLDEDGVRRRDARTLSGGDHELTFTTDYGDFGIEVDIEPRRGRGHRPPRRHLDTGVSSPAVRRSIPSWHARDVAPTPRPRRAGARRLR